MKLQERSRIVQIDLRMTFAATAVAMLMLVVPAPGHAQTFTLLHTFTGGTDGARPYAGLTLDQAGNLYGTASGGGANRNGTVFKLTHSGAGWLLNTLYSFTNMNNDGAQPQSRVVFGPDGTLYGTTYAGGPDEVGTVFNLRPPVSTCRSSQCSWTETVLHGFPDPVTTDGFYPSGDFTVDQQGNLYGTTSAGGAGAPYECLGLGCGVVYEMSRSQGVWTESIVYAFTGGADGGVPNGGVTFDRTGNLYGTNTMPWGRIFRLMPSEPGWTESTLYDFQNDGDGAYPESKLMLDRAGNLYSTTYEGGAYEGGTVFELQSLGSAWNFQTIYNFNANGPSAAASALVMDAAGNLYGTTAKGGANGDGAVFKLTPSGGGWTYTSLHDFTAGSDGSSPVSGVVLDASGNLYGTTLAGGQSGNGVVFEITPN
jgi:uncharacterized repeat protein (TIGR03803 family)